MWIDSHCHLDAAEFDADRAQVWQQARAAGVEALLVPAVSLAGCASVAACCRAQPGCRPAYGIHPMYVHAASPTDLTGLAAWIEQERPLALGEIGLDGYVTPVDSEGFRCQEEYFTAQLRLARELELPVVLHVRRAVDQVLKHLRRIRVPGGIAHAFNGSRQQAEEFIKLGFKLGFGGTLTYSGSTRIRALAAQLPLDALVLETDAPDIPPAWRAGQRNSPAELPAIGRLLAELRGMSPADLAAATSANARAVLPGL